MANIRETSPEFWERVDELRGNMSIRDLAEKAGVSEPSLQTIRVMKTLPKIPITYAISLALGTTIEYLYTGVADEKIEDDVPLFKKIASDQNIVDICQRLVECDKMDIEIVRRVLGLPPKTLKWSLV